MASFNKFNAVAANPWNGAYVLSTDTLKVLLTNTVPNVANVVYADIVGELATANGYTLGGAVVTTSSSTQTAGLYKLIGSVANPTWTASGSVGPFRYVVAYDVTAVAPLVKPLLGWWDFGSSITMVNGDTFTVVFDATNGILQMS